MYGSLGPVRSSKTGEQCLVLQVGVLMLIIPHLKKASWLRKKIYDFSYSCRGYWFLIIMTLMMMTMMISDDENDDDDKTYSLFVGHSYNIQLFWEKLLEKMCMQQSREVICDMINTLFLTLSLSKLLLLLSFSACKHTSLASCAILSNFIEKNRELKITHNTFWDCCVHFFQQPFSK